MMRVALEVQSDARATAEGVALRILSHGERITGGGLPNPPAQISKQQQRLAHHITEHKIVGKY